MAIITASAITIGLSIAGGTALGSGLTAWLLKRKRLLGNAIAGKEAPAASASDRSEAQPVAQPRSRRQPSAWSPRPAVPGTLNPIFGELSLADFIAVLDQQPLPIFLRDNDGKVLFQNAAFVRLNDSSPRQLVEVSTDKGRVRRLRAGSPLTAQPNDSNEQWLVSIDGQERRYSMLHYPIDRPGGGFSIGAMRDVTEQHQLRMQLQFSQRLETLGTLASGLAHDFNNLLTPILGYSSLLLDSDSIVMHRDKLQAIADAAHKARQVSRQLLAFTSGRPSTSERERVELDTAAGEAKRFLEATLAKQVRIQVDAPKGCAVLIDSGELNQVLMNLATNAIQAIGDNPGELRFEVRRHDAGDLYVPEALRASECARISVIDNGPGISSALQARIFEPFFTTKAPEEGSGLGLSVARNIIDQNQGALCFVSPPEGGARFDLFFPALPPAAATETGEPIETLLVETQPIATRTLRDLVLSLGFNVTSTASPVSALVAVEREPTRYGLVVLGSVTEDTDSVEFRQQLRRIRPSLPLLNLTRPAAADDVALPQEVAALEAAIEQAFEDFAA